MRPVTAIVARLKIRTIRDGEETPMKTSTTRRGLLAAGLAATLVPPRARAQSQPIRIGVLTDMAGPYAANTGPGSVAASRMAVEDFMAAHPSIKVELLSADMQDKPDVAISIARDWLDTQQVDLITDLPLSSGALAVGALVDQRDKAAIWTGAASAELTGKACGPNHLHWVLDTWSMPHAVVDATMKEGGRTWFFITADYAFGHALEHDCAGFVTAGGGKVLGEMRTPFPGTTDFSAPLVAARASKADVIAFANGGTDTVNCIKQAAEFGIIKGGQKIAALIFLLPDVHGVGLQAAQGVLLTDAFYWDMNEQTRAFGHRFAKVMNGAMPSSDQAGQYSAITAYLNAVAAVGVDKAKASGRAVFAQMRAHPIQDALFGECHVRIDGRVTHNMYLFEVKSPAESKGPWDYLKLRRTIPAAQAFRPLHDGGCPLVKS
jgi:branched-chain amino acid transport system substrate-binding protein